MSKKSRTTATFAIRIQIPTGYNTNMMQTYIRDAVGGWAGGKSPDDPIFGIKPTDFTVALIRKETIYGKG